MVCSFLVSGVVHEAVAFVAMRRTFWPFNTFFLCLSACMTPVWDALFPVVPTAGGVDVTDPPSAASRSSRSVAATGADGCPAAAGAEAFDEPAAVAATSVRAAEAPPASPAEAVKARRRSGGGPSSNGGAPGSNSRVRPDQPSPKLDVCEGGDVDHPEERCGPEGGGPSGSAGRRGTARPKMGSWRGWTSIVFYFVGSVPVTLALDYIVWQYWRHTFLVE